MTGLCVGLIIVILIVVDIVVNIVNIMVDGVVLLDDLHPSAGPLLREVSPLVEAIVVEAAAPRAWKSALFSSVFSRILVSCTLSKPTFMSLNSSTNLYILPDTIIPEPQP